MLIHGVAAAKICRLYVRYKTQGVSTDEITACDSTDDLRERYKGLFQIRLRLNKCLEARQQVHELYDDDDEGHATAIAYVEEQIHHVDALLANICQQLHDMRPCRADVDPAPDGDQRGTIGTARKKCRRKSRRNRRHTPSIEEECERLRAESTVLDAVREEALQKVCDAYECVCRIIEHDKGVSDDMRQILIQTQAKTGDLNEMYEIAGIICAGVMYTSPQIPKDPYVDIVNNTALERMAFFYHNDVTEDMLRAAVFSFQKGLIHKRELVRRLDKDVQFCLKLFQALFSSSSQYTTNASCDVIVSLRFGISCLVNSGTLACRPTDAIHRKALVGIYGEETMKDIEETTRRLIILYDEGAAWPADTSLPWAAIRLGTNDTYISDAHLASFMILGKTSKQPFL